MLCHVVFVCTVNFTENFHETFMKVFGMVSITAEWAFTCSKSTVITPEQGVNPSELYQ